MYDLDYPEFPAIIAGPRGFAGNIDANSRRIYVPTENITITDSIHQSEIPYKRFPAFDRCKERVAISVAIKEDDRIFGIIDKAAIASGQTVTNSTSDFTRGNATTMLGHLYSRNLAPGAYLMHGMRYASAVLGWGQDQVDQATMNVIIETGMLGVLHGVRLIVSPRVSPTKVYLTTTPDKLGRIPERKSLEVYAFHQTWKLRYLITAWENLGFVIHNSAGVASTNLTGGSTLVPQPVKYPIS